MKITSSTKSSSSKISPVRITVGEREQDGDGHQSHNCTDLDWKKNTF